MFNLVKNPWIPTFGGKLLSLEEVFTDLSKISTIEGNFVERASILRLLICIAQAALKGPKTEEEWKTCKKNISAQSLQYLKKWSKKFDLYGEKAFLQMPWLPPLKNKTRFELYRLPFGEHLLFYKSVQEEAGDAQTALSLLLAQLFSVGGTVWGQIPEFKWLGQKIPHLVSATGTLFYNVLVTVIEGDTLLDTVHNNMIPVEWLKEGKVNFGSPVWEYGEFKKSGNEAKEISSSYLSNLVPLTRGIVLYPGEKEMTVVEGVAHLDFPAYREPMASCKKEIEDPKKKKKEGKEKPYVSCTVDRAGWRDLEAIVNVPVQGVSLKSGVMAFRHFAKSNKAPLTISVGGMACNQAKLEGIIEWSYQLPPNFLRVEILPDYASFVRDAEETAKRLCQAFFVCLKEDINIDSSRIVDGLRTKALTEYWPRMESLALRKINDLGRGIRGGNDTILKIATEIYNRNCPEVSVNAMVKGLNFLLKGGSDK